MRVGAERVGTMKAGWACGLDIARRILPLVPAPAQEAAQGPAQGSGRFTPDVIFGETLLTGRLPANRTSMTST
ncbi:MAG: hypothetical protein AB1486_20805 [Planctomycetota bacterium]